MNTPIILKSLLAAAIGISLSALPNLADAQGRGVAERQARRDAQERAPARSETMFPHATRESPATELTQRMGPRVIRLQDMLEGPENAQQVIDEATRLREDRAANDYVRSFADIQMADAYEELGDEDNMIRMLERAVETGGLGNDNHFQTMLRLGQSLVIAERTEEGLAWLDRFFEESRSERPEHLALMGNVYYQEERYDEAIDYLNRAIAAHDDPPGSWRHVLMASLAEGGRSDDAIRVARELAEAEPDNKQAAMNLASAYLQADRYDEAAAVLDEARGRGLLTEARDYDQLARIYLNIDGREADAAEILQAGLDDGVLEPSAEVYSNLGQAYYFSENIEPAIEAWRQAAQLATDGAPALNLARVLYNEGRFTEARDYANQAVERGVGQPEDARQIIRNADIAIRQGH